MISTRRAQCRTGALARRDAPAPAPRSRSGSRIVNSAPLPEPVAVRLHRRPRACSIDALRRGPGRGQGRRGCGRAWRRPARRAGRAAASKSGLMPAPVVAYPKDGHGPARVLLQCHRDVPAAARELRGIAEQVADGLREAGRIAAHPQRPLDRADFQLEPGVGRRGIGGPRPCVARDRRARAGCAGAAILPRAIRVTSRGRRRAASTGRPAGR